MIKLKILSEYDVKEYQVTFNGKNHDMKIGTYGIFDTISVHWDYYAVSFIRIGGDLKLVSDLSTSLNASSSISNDVSSLKYTIENLKLNMNPMPF